MIVGVPLLFSPLFFEYGAPKMVVAQVLSFSLAIFWVTSMVLDGEIIVLDTSLYYTFLAFLSVNFVSLFQAYNAFQGLDNLFRYVCFFGIAIQVFHIVQTPRHMHRLAVTMALTGGIVAFIGLLQYNEIYHFYAPWSMPVSTIGNVNFTAQYYDIVLPISLVMLFVVRSVWMRIGVGVACFLMACHVIVLGSRGGWFGIGCGLAILGGLVIFRHFRMGRRFVDAGVLFVVLVGLGWPVLTGMLSGIQIGGGRNIGNLVDDYWIRVSNRIQAGIQIADDSTLQRIYLWEDTVRLLFDRPVLGVGVGNFEFNIPKYASRESLEIKHRLEKNLGQDLMAFQAHNEYLEIGAETGILGLLVFGVFLYQLGGALFGGLLRYIREDGDLLVVGLAAAVGGTLIHSAFDSNLQQPASAVHFWIVVGLIWSLKLNAEGRKPLELLFTGARDVAIGMIVLFGLVLGITLFIGARTLIGEYYFLKGRQAFDMKAYPLAEAFWQRATVYGPTKYFRTYQALGTALYNQQKWQEAIPDFQKSLSYFPNNARVLYLLGRAYMHTGDAQTAIAHLRTAVSLNPLMSEFKLGLAEALGSAGHTQEALSMLQNMLTYMPDDPAVFYLMGSNHKRLGDLDAAITAYQKAIDLDPDNLEYKNSLAVAHSEHGSFEDAHQLFLALVAAAPDQVDYRFNLSVSLVVLEHYDQALEHLKAVVALEPNYVRAYVVLGQVLTAQARYEEAVQAYRQALRLQPNDPTIREALQQLGAN